MAKQAKSTSQVDSEYDISKYIDLDDPILEEEEEDGEYTTIPHREAEIITPGLDGDLEEAIEGYIKAGKVSWGDKRNLRRLAAENRELEDAVRDVDPELLAKTKSYHSIVVGILKEKDSLGQLTLDDSDPYDAEVTEPVEVSDEAKSSKRESNEIFTEIERLESHRTELNGKRVAALEEIREITSSGENDGSRDVQKLVTEKLEGIARLADITKSKVTLEDEEEFERGVGELTDYMENGFDPLAYDEDADFVSPQDEDRDRVYSVDELLALDEGKPAQKVQKPAAGPSFGELFGVSSSAKADRAEDKDGASSSTGGATPSFLDAFSSSESADELDDALGGENLEPDTSSPADEDSFELEEPASDAVFLPTEPISVAELAELDAEDGPEAVAADLSDSESDYDEYDAEQEMLAEGGFWSEPEGAEDSAESPVEEEFDATAAGFVIDESAPGRAVIFEELKAKYGISFEGTPGLED